MVRTGDPAILSFETDARALGRPLASAVTRRTVVDGVARWVVRAGGMTTIASILAILAFIAAEVEPLFRAPAADVKATLASVGGRGPVAAAVDESRDVLELIGRDGVARFVSLSDRKVLQEIPIPGLASARIAAVTRAGRDHLLLATDDGRLVGIRIPFDVVRSEGRRTIRPRLKETGTWTLSDTGEAPALLAASVPGAGGVTVVSARADGPPEVFTVQESRNLFGALQRTGVRHPLPVDGDARPTTLVVDAAGTSGYIGTSDGRLYHWDLSNPAEPVLMDALDATVGRDVPVTALGFLLGDRSVIVGDAAGKVSVWFPVRDESRPTGWRLARVHELTPHKGAVTAVAPSPRGRSFLTTDATGQVLLRHATSGQTLLDIANPIGPLSTLAFAPKANGALGVNSAGASVDWDIHNPHPEVSWTTLFGKVWYEGYPAPEYVWQSSGGTDDFEPKLSLVPLVFGTMKGTVYALFFALPIAVLGAVYTSQFAHPALRHVVKPTVEIMAALPSVVLGFLAGLWLAPAIEPIVPGVLATAVVLPLLVLGFGAIWHRLPVAVRRWCGPGTEVIVLLPLLLLGVQACLAVNDPLERVLFGGDFRTWLYQSAGLRFDQRNAMIVGFVMGFAVIPIIFTISEDALSNVPQHLTSASLALGATPWQTAVRVVLPTASPGIFSATMIGFGRAVGETMIVLMATGNTPVLDWNVFNGMRTLSANIAVEIPEAPHGGTLYRVLFLTALLLFIATFLVNTVAELVRLRLRRRYQQL